jgi:manganese transport protein
MFRRAMAFVGPGYLVSVGYMDPGNWATSIAGGAQFGYALLFVALLSNIMAIILQSLCARLAIGSGALAQACRDAFPRPVAFVLWIFAEIAIIATDIAEVVGTAIGLNLLFGIPLELGVIITALILPHPVAAASASATSRPSSFQGDLCCFFLQIAWPPDGGYRGQSQMLTVMPRLISYLHSPASCGLGCTACRKTRGAPAPRFSSLRRRHSTKRGVRRCVRLRCWVHAGAQALCHSLLAGLNSTVTATLAGQIVMEGFLNIRLPAWLRRLATRMVAIVPAAGVTIYYGADGTGTLLILSQVILAFQLPFAIVPLVMFTRDRAKMGALVAPGWLTVVAGIIAAIIIALNMKLLWDLATG